MPLVIGLQVALASRLPMRSVERIEAMTGHGIAGDRYENSRHRHLTVQSAEELALAEAEVGRSLDPLLTRRNVTVDAGPLDRSPGARARLGTIELEVVRDAAPCKLLEDGLGRDAKLALHRRAGVVYRVVGGGEARLGDEFVLEARDEPGNAATDC